jgi:hypothetical protein
MILKNSSYKKYINVNRKERKRKRKEAFLSFDIHAVSNRTEQN